MRIVTRRRLTLAAFFGTFVLSLLAASPAQADRWRGGDIRHFDHDRWHEGRWDRDWHDGRLGWWWVVAGTWYFYPRPIYPYPDPYVPPEYIPVAVPTAPATPGPAPAQYWYYCPGSKTYYPYVATCAGGWQQVPVTQAPPK
jgi:hypothetical protein